MKSAEQWLNEVGEVVMFSAFVGGKPPGKEVELLIAKMQLDAWKHGMSEAADRVADYFAKHPATSTAILRQVIINARDSRSTP